MKVLLIKDVKSLGKAGEIKEVKDGYGNNFLIGKGYAKAATTEVLRQYEANKKKEAARIEEEIEKTQSLANLLKSTSINIQKQIGANGALFGSITKDEIANALKEQKAIEIDKKSLEFDTIKSSGIYEITAKINPSAKVFPAVKGNISPKILFDIGPYKNANQAYDKKVTSWLNIKSPNLASSFRPASVNGAIGVSKPKIIAHSDIDSFCLEFDEPIEPLALLSGISTVQDQYGDSILRIKGIIDLKGQDKPIVIHGVLGNLYPLAELKGWPEGEKKSQLVFICRASVLEQIKHMFKEVMLNPDSAAVSYYQQMIDGIEKADE